MKLFTSQPPVITAATASAAAVATDRMADFLRELAVIVPRCRTRGRCKRALLSNSTNTPFEKPSREIYAHIPEKQGPNGNLVYRHHQSENPRFPAGNCEGPITH